MTCACGCGQEFERKGNHYQLYASKHCAYRAAGRAWRLRNRVPVKQRRCASASCTRQFLTRGTRRAFCSRTCRDRANKRTQRALQRARRAA